MGGANSFLRIKIHSHSVTIKGKFRERTFTVVPKPSVFLIFQALGFPGVKNKYRMTCKNSKYSKVMKRNLIFSIRRDGGVSRLLTAFSELCLSDSTLKTPTRTQMCFPWNTEHG